MAPTANRREHHHLRREPSRPSALPRVGRRPVPDDRRHRVHDTPAHTHPPHPPTPPHQPTPSTLSTSPSLTAPPLCPQDQPDRRVRSAVVDVRRPVAPNAIPGIPGHRPRHHTDPYISSNPPSVPARPRERISFIISTHAKKKAARPRFFVTFSIRVLNPHTTPPSPSLPPPGTYFDMLFPRKAAVLKLNQKGAGRPDRD